MAQKETILGNYLGFERFPLDCESIEYLQANTQLLSVIARLSGCDKLILSGCDITSGSTRAEGYVYIRTGNDLVGEVVYFKGGTGTRCKIVPTNFDVTANGETFTNAYTKRILESSSSPSDMAWNDFTKLSDISNAALKNYADTKVREESSLRSNGDASTLGSAKAYTDTKLTSSSVAFVRGMIMMWSGAANQIPSGWALCNGQNGTPPLQDKFIVGAGGSYPVGKSLGSTTHYHSGAFDLNASDLPKHRHRFSGDDRMGNRQDSSAIKKYDNSSPDVGSDGTGAGCQWLTGDSIFNSSGNLVGASDSVTKRFNTGSASNLPPYYALCFIMKL